MPRAVGQIDHAKSEAMLDAASAVMSERGLGAPVEAIAKRAGVSKQTLYNHFGGKDGLVRALVRRRVDQMTAPLSDSDHFERPEGALAAYAQALMESVLSPTSLSVMRVAIHSALDMPDMAQTFYEAGPATSRRRLAEFLSVESEAGRLEVDDPALAAELFSAMVGSRQVRALLGLETPKDPDTIRRLSRAIAHRFVRAYAPKA
ncbi:TetR/AcrR family transcriptional regulator [Phenylobacterium montanum]|uniref:TetR/AcrR family transcriptional regulator n=1 Tax=Phenylobacterium montanum TaxID=2823693 RepID=A0A975G240_9CAUL|nr:TetR/AcrR family transcriptional regulator [Caulobacter sp. S6]QUD89359.1 TetR/AcrR family transcriptional regulator [Caulobacter sp. S6]